MGWADDMYDAGYTSNHGGLMDAPGYRGSGGSNIKREKATKRVPLCNAREMNEFVDGLIEAWESNERTQEEVHEKCVLLMADAALGKPVHPNGKAVYAKALGVKLRALGCFMDEAPKAKVLKDSPKELRDEIESNEFQQLIAEMTPLGFTNSSQVSSYIMRNKLGLKYKHISGVVTMKKDGSTWDFKGGFPPKIYAEICSALDLDNNGSYAKVVSFNSFNELNF